MERITEQAVNDALWHALGDDVVLAIYQDGHRRRHGGREADDQWARAFLGIGWGGTVLR